MSRSTRSRQYEYRALHWFRRLVGLGLALNLLFIVPGLLAPRLLEAWGDFGITNTPHWLQNTALLLAIITVLYIPVIRDPFRYLFVSFAVVGGRFAAGVLFLFGLLFLDYPQGMLVLAGSDLTLSALQAVALQRMLADGDPRAGW